MLLEPAADRPTPETQAIKATIAEIGTHIATIGSDMAAIRTRVERMLSPLHWMVLGAAWFFLLMVAF